jgi:hypothetical protein
MRGYAVTCRTQSDCVCDGIFFRPHCLGLRGGHLLCLAEQEKRKRLLKNIRMFWNVFESRDDLFVPFWYSKNEVRRWIQQKAVGAARQAG